MPDKKEKRRASRISVSLSGKYKIVGKKNSRWTHVFCEDIGGLGLRLIVDEPLKVNERLKISISRKDNKEPLLINCKVVRCMKEGPALFRVGVEIAEVEDPLPFIEFIGDMLLNLRHSSITICRKRRK